MFSKRILRSAIVLIAECLHCVCPDCCENSAGKTSSKTPGKTSGKNQAAHAKGAATVAEAQAFMKKAEDQLADLGVRASRASWVQENFITDDTETMSAQANEKLTAVVTQLALDARRFDGLKMPPDLARKFLLLKLSLTAPAPNNDAERKELTELASKLDGMYGKGKYCKQVDGKQKCFSLNDLSRIMATSTNPDELLDAWVGWHKISVPMKDKYARFVKLSNEGATELGFKDTGAMWRSNYDMSPEEFSAEVERLWRQVEPFYISLHTYVRKQLIKKYGKAAERPDGMIPAHLLGNMWAQEWGNVYPLVAPADGGQGYDLTQAVGETRPGFRTSNARQRKKDGEVWRELFYLAGICAASPDLLGAVTVCEAAGPRRGVPRQRMGHRRKRRFAAEVMH